MLDAPISFSALIPEIIVFVAGCTVLLLGQGGHSGRRLAPWAALAGLVIAIGVVLLESRDARVAGEIAAAGSGLLAGWLTWFVRMSALELGILLTLVNWSGARDEERGEFLSMMLFSLTGLLLVAPANNFIVLFLALELVSIPTYIMVVLSRNNVRSVEAGTKYFYLGAAAAAIMAYGFALLYGVTGTAQLVSTYNAAGELVAPGAIAVLSEILRTPGTLQFSLATAGVLLAIGGLLFKIAAVPLHFYIADVYQGAASPVAGLLGFVPKLAGIVAIAKILVLTGNWAVTIDGVFWLLWIVSALSMTVGNVLALRQTSVKRLLAYSGVAHAGYMLVGLLAGPLAGGEGGAFGIVGDGTAAALFYMVIYGIANLGAFAVLALLRYRNQAAESLRDLAGLIRVHPGPALLLVLAMFTLMGLPPTPGFWGKLSLFGSALAAGQSGLLPPGREGWMLALVIIAVLNSALAAAYYLRVIGAVLLYDNEQPAYALPREAQSIGALLCGFLLLIFAFYPNVLMSAGKAASSELAQATSDAMAPPAAPIDMPPLFDLSPPGDGNVSVEPDATTPNL
jgi:NADH-quinone oxidoreductase subunit N